MEDQHSFNSPRRTLSYSRNRGATFSVFEADNKASGVGVSGEHGPNPSEVYGFVGAISTVVATGILCPLKLLLYVFLYSYFNSRDLIRLPKTFMRNVL